MPFMKEKCICMDVYFEKKNHIIGKNLIKKMKRIQLNALASNNQMKEICSTNLTNNVKTLDACINYYIKVKPTNPF